MAETKTMTGRAIVAHDTLENKGLKMEQVTTRPIEDDELLVEIVASGVCFLRIYIEISLTISKICHTDVQVFSKVSRRASS